MNPKDMNLNVKKYERNNRNNSDLKKDNQAYGYYSRVLKEPFDSVEELKKAEEAYFAELKAKEDRSAQKKADAEVVEEAFKALNAARKAYKSEIAQITDAFSEATIAIKKTFEEGVKGCKDRLATAETAYKQALKAFTDKYPEGYHLTLKDGDFETTISGSAKGSTLNELVSGNPFFDLIFKDFL